MVILLWRMMIFMPFSFHNSYLLSSLPHHLNHSKMITISFLVLQVLKSSLSLIQHFIMHLTSQIFILIYQLIVALNSFLIEFLILLLTLHLMIVLPYWINLIDHFFIRWVVVIFLMTFKVHITCIIYKLLLLTTYLLEIT